MAEKDLEEQLKQLRSDFATLQEDVAALASALKESGTERIEGARLSAAERLRARSDELRRELRAAQARGRQTVDEVENLLSDHPLGSVAIAFGLGFIIAKLLDIGGRR